MAATAVSTGSRPTHRCSMTGRDDPIDTLPAEGQPWWAERQRLDAGPGSLVSG